MLMGWIKIIFMREAFRKRHADTGRPAFPAQIPVFAPVNSAGKAPVMLIGAAVGMGKGDVAACFRQHNPCYGPELCAG